MNDGNKTTAKIALGPTLFSLCSDGLIPYLWVEICKSRYFYIDLHDFGQMSFLQSVNKEIAILHIEMAFPCTTQAAL